MKHIDYEAFGALSILEGCLGLIFISLGVRKGFFIPIGILFLVISIAQLYVILFNKDK